MVAYARLIGIGRGSKSVLNDPPRGTWGQRQRMEGDRCDRGTCCLLSVDTLHSHLSLLTQVLQVRDMRGLGEAKGLAANVRTWVLKQSLQEWTSQKRV